MHVRPNEDVSEEAACARIDRVQWQDCRVRLVTSVSHAVIRSQQSSASHGAANGSAGKSTARHAGGGLSELDWTGQAGGRRDELSGGGPRRTVEKMNAERRSESGADRLPAFSSHYGRAAAPNRDRSIGN